MLLQSTITCPHCAVAKTETMPTDSCQFCYECTGCGTKLKPKAGDCCVFCSYGSVPCPPIQAQRAGEPRRRVVLCLVDRDLRADLAGARATSCDSRHSDARGPAALSAVSTAEWSARSEKEQTTMQSMEQTNAEIRELTDAELETINGGSIIRWIVKHVHDLFAGPGDHRRPLDRPN